MPLTAIVVLLTAFIATPSSAQTIEEKRIAFETGTTGAEINGRIAGGTGGTRAPADGDRTIVIERGTSPRSAIE